MKAVKRKTRSDKFPLTLHQSGQYCKKIKGKIYYFGKDKHKALDKYLERCSELYGTKFDTLKAENDEMTLSRLCGTYLIEQNSLMQINAITSHHHGDQHDSLKKFMNFIGPNKKIKNITTLELQNYKKMLKTHFKTASRVNLHISIMKALFHWAKKSEILDNIPNIDAISREKISRKQRYTYSAAEIRKLLYNADEKMKAMIWLGLNCGFGCTDCSELKWKDIDFENSRIMYPRHKTGIYRNLPLWPETVKALKKISRKSKLVFITSKGNAYVRTKFRQDPDGNERFVEINTLSTLFNRLIKRAGLNVPDGTGFYSLRRTAATMAARSGDPFAVQRLLGHADLKMASRYVQDVSKQTDEVIAKNRAYILNTEAKSHKDL